MKWKAAILAASILALPCPAADSDRKKVSSAVPWIVTPRTVVKPLPVRNPRPLKEIARSAYPRTHFERAMYYKQRQEPSKALVELLRATQQDPRYALAYYEQAVLFRELGYRKLAESALIRALAIRPDFQQARVLMATVRLEQGNIGGAVQELSKSLGLRPSAEQAADTSTGPASTNERQELEQGTEPQLLQMPHGSLPLPPGARDKGITMLLRPANQTNAPLTSTTTKQGLEGGVALSPQQAPLADLLKGIPGIDPAAREARPSSPASKEQSSKEKSPAAGDQSKGSTSGADSSQAKTARIKRATKERRQRLQTAKREAQSKQLDQPTTRFRFGKWLSIFHRRAADEPRAVPEELEARKIEAQARKIQEKAKRIEDRTRRLTGKQEKERIGKGRGKKTAAWTSPLNWMGRIFSPRGNTTFQEKRQMAMVLHQQAKMSPGNAQRAVPSTVVAAGEAVSLPEPARAPDTMAPKPHPERPAVQGPVFASAQAYPQSSPPAPQANSPIPSPSPPAIAPEPSRPAPARPPTAVKLPPPKPSESWQVPLILPPKPTLGLSAPMPSPPLQPPDLGSVARTFLPSPHVQPIRQAAAPEVAHSPAQPAATNQLLPLPKSVTIIKDSSVKLPEFVTKAPHAPVGPIPVTLAQATENAPLPPYHPTKSVRPNLVALNQSPVAGSPSLLPIVVNQAKRSAASPMPVRAAKDKTLTDTDRAVSAALGSGKFHTRTLPETPRGTRALHQAIPGSKLDLMQRARDRSTKSGAEQGPAKEASPVVDPWIERLKYLSEHGTASLKDGEAFMFSEETGEACLFLSDGSVVRRMIAGPKDPLEVARLRRPDILQPAEPYYRLSLLGKLLPKQEQSEENSAAQDKAPGFTLDQLLEKQSEGFLGWLRHLFKL